MNKLVPAGLLAASSAVTGCVSISPDYERIDAPVPEQFAAYGAFAQSTAPLTWRGVIENEHLRGLIETALEDNRDLKIAAANVRLAKAQYGITGAARLPSVSISAQAREGDTFEDDATLAAQSAFSDSASANLAVTSYELDLFGRVASLNQSALQSWLATVEGERAAKISVSAAIAETWIQLAANKQLLELSQETAESQYRSLELTQRLFETGVSNELAVRRASSSVHSARADAAQFEALMRQNINALRLLVGSDLPENLIAYVGEDAMPVASHLPIVNSSDILLLRPDILQAERNLIAANADIAAARAAFFPRISLSAGAGYVSADLSDLIDPMSGGWSFTPQISLPIFDAGARRQSLNVSKAAEDIALAQYERAIQAGFRDVANAMIDTDSILKRLDALESLVEDTGVTLELSQQRFRVGVDNYLSVLDAQRAHFSARQRLITAQRDLALNSVAIYRALGSWPDEPV